MTVFELMAAPFAECLILVAIHTYLGIHVLERRVIFVDLALAQIAALGTTVGFLFGILPDTWGSLLYSMAFAFLGAGVFTLSRFRQERVPQEAIIGLTYAVSSAVAVLVVEKTRGAEHLEDILVGNLLWVTWPEVLSAAVVYAIVGALHYRFRQPLLLISVDPQEAFRQGLRVRAWDFLFYMTFGVVIAFSTRVAGVLLVFVFLVAPAILAFVITKHIRLRLLIGWTVGTVVTMTGLTLSWVLDLPSGPAVIVLYGVAVVAGALVVAIVRAEKRSHTAGRLALGSGTALLVVMVLWAGGRLLGVRAASRLSHTVEATLAQQEHAQVALQAEAAVSRAAALQEALGECAAPDTVQQYLTLSDPEQQMVEIRKRLTIDRASGLRLLIVALADVDLPLLYREEAAQLAEGTLGQRFGYNPEGPAPVNTAAVRQLCSALGPQSRR